MENQVSKKTSTKIAKMTTVTAVAASMMLATLTLSVLPAVLPSASAFGQGSGGSIGHGGEGGGVGIGTGGSGFGGGFGSGDLQCGEGGGLATTANGGQDGDGGGSC